LGTHLNRHSSFQYEKEIVSVVVFVPDEFALQFRDHHVVPVEFTNGSWLPVLRERRESFHQIDSPHRRWLRTLNNVDVSVLGVIHVMIFARLLRGAFSTHR
jgi:hypothetical protein